MTLTNSAAVFCHHVYEYEKGVRGLVLHTASANELAFIETKLKNRKIPHVIYPIGKNKVNVFFGRSSCVEVIKNIGKKDLRDYNEEEDFILGILLGYDKIQQCERYLKRRQSIAKLLEEESQQEIEEERVFCNCPFKGSEEVPA